MIEATATELKWINDFKKLAKRCPKSLWLFSGSGTLWVMKLGENGKRVMTPGTGGIGSGGGVDPNYGIDTIKIPNDGGDW